MPVLITCRICKGQGVTSDSLLSDVCAQCADKGRKLLVVAWKDRHNGQSTSEGSQTSFRLQEPPIDSKIEQEHYPRRASGKDDGLVSGTGGAGEAIAKITKALGIPECGGCGQRRAAMNQVDLNGTALSVFRGLAEAILHPEKVLEKEPENEETVNQAEARGQK